MIVKFNPNPKPIVIEIWRPVPFFPGYYVSNRGRVRSDRKVVPCKSRSGLRFLKTLPPVMLSLKPHARTGYPEVMLYRNRKGYHRSVHVLVCETFVGPAPSVTGRKMTVDHKDGVRDNNIWTNLRWATCTEQQETSKRLGTKPIGERHYKAILTDEQIEEILARYKPYDRKNSFGAMALEYGVDKSTLSKIFNGVNRVSALT